jgi:T1SS-143 domain-containing protein
VLPLVVEAEDIDGTQAISRSELSIIDGQLPTLSTSSADVSEADLANNNASVNGTIDWLIGSDRLVDITLDERGPQLSSGGEALSYSVDSTGLLLTATDGINSIFTLELAERPDSSISESLNFTFTLLQALDHFDDAGNNIANLPLSFGYTVTDYDGDQISSTIDITVADSTPGNVDSVTLTVSEAPRSLGSIVSNISAADTVYFDLNANQDEITTIRFTQQSGSAVLDSSGDPVLQNNGALTWQQNSDSSLSIINAAGEVVVDFSLPTSLSINNGNTSMEDAELSVTILQALDQTTGDSLSIKIPVAVADFDLSEQPAQATITIDDGRNPIDIAIQGLDVSEADLVTDNANDTGRSFIIRGSDELTTTNILLETEVKSNTTIVDFATEPDSDGWWIGSINSGADDNSGADEIFRLRVSADGNSEFILSGPIDHPVIGEGALFFFARR